MADTHSNSTTVRGIDYRATFPFVHLFKGFRLAIDPSKLLLALALLLLVYAGGRGLDAVWPEKHLAFQNELDAYAQFNPRPSATRLNRAETTLRFADFTAVRDEQVAARTARLKLALQSAGHADYPADYDGLVRAYRVNRDAAVDNARKTYDGVNAKTDADREIRDRAIASAGADYARSVHAAEDFRREGLFIHFLQFEIDRVDAVVVSAVNLDVAGVLSGLRDLFVTAPVWAFRYHPVYFTLFFAWLLVLWSIFGGALARIAAVQVARDEKISVRGALRFSTGKVLSFVFAPLIPVIIVAVLGLVIAAASFLISVPGVSGVWSVVVGAAFIFALLAGFVMMLTTAGLVGGGHLMFPTIASEGSDSFDAVSRSFSYLYARPWQLGFYALVSIIYGAITYLVVRLAVFVLLLLVHASVSLFQWGTVADGTPVIDAMWPRPTHFMTLSYEIDYPALGPVQKVGATLIAFWVYLAISVLGAYVISLYVSSSTLVYFLLRRDVDATEMDEVYLEPSDDELTEAVAANTVDPAVRSDGPIATDEPAGQPVDVPAPPPDEKPAS